MLEVEAAEAIRSWHLVPNKIKNLDPTFLIRQLSNVSLLDPCFQVDAHV